MKPAYMKASEYREKYFVKGSQPAASTIRRWIRDGDLPGKVIGKVHYVDISSLQQTGNPLVDKVLQAS
ncbi:MAG: DNA-binding protein [Marinobacterium sp.]|nr:DNA-binding protein [Marinobacterium sp.]